MTDLYLVRHGTPNKEDVDPQKNLSEYGRKEVTSIARLLENKVSVKKIYHSGKLRARQTAEILGDHLNVVVEEKQGLSPNDDVSPIARKFVKENTNIMIAGHLPFLSRLASLLLCGNQETEIVRFEPGAVATLAKTNNNEEDSWIVTHVISPSITGQS